MKNNKKIEEKEMFLGSKEERTISFKFTTRDMSKIPISIVSDFLTSLQNTLNNIGNYIMGGEYRKRGQSPELVIESCELVLIEAKPGSLEVVTQISSSQGHLDGSSVGQNAIEKFDRVVQVIDMNDDLDASLSPVIGKITHRKKILRGMVNIWPSEKEKYDIDLKLGTNPNRLLKKERKHKIISYVSDEEREEDMVLIGPLVQTRVVKPYRLVIGVPPNAIKCNFLPKLEQDTKKHLGEPVIVRGRAILDDQGNINLLDKVKSIEQLNKFSIRQISYENNELKLKYPLVAEVDFVEEMLILQNDDFQLLAIAPTWEDCLTEFNADFYALWEDIALASDDELTHDAIQLKKKLFEIVEIVPNDHI